MLEMAGPWITTFEREIVEDALLNGWYGDEKYKYVEQFEQAFATYHHRKHALMTTNCTSAIHLLLAGLDLPQHCDIIVPDCTWIGSCAPIKYINANPIFADIAPDTWCINGKTLEKAITPNTKAAIIVDLYGNMPAWNELESIANKHDIILIEDAAEALGSQYCAQRAGQFGHASVFSFHRTKTITTGEGGMLLLDDDSLYERCKFLRDHGRDEKRHYYTNEVAYKYMPFNLQAALGYAQFLRLEELVEYKQWILNTYKHHLSDMEDLQFNDMSNNVINGAWATTLIIGSIYRRNKEQIIDELATYDLPCRPFFYPLSTLPAFNQTSIYASKK